jgi:hypothetical protein
MIIIGLLIGLTGIIAYIGILYYMFSDQKLF